MIAYLKNKPIAEFGQSPANSRFNAMWSVFLATEKSRNTELSYIFSVDPQTKLFL